jgi:hypothetical protein
MISIQLTIHTIIRLHLDGNHYVSVMKMVGMA